MGIILFTVVTALTGINGYATRFTLPQLFTFGDVNTYKQFHRARGEFVCICFSRCSNYLHKGQPGVLPGKEVLKRR